VILQLEDVGRRFNKEWIFRHIGFTAHPGKPVALLGGNGSGKSTLLKVCAGVLQPSEGKVTLVRDSIPVEPANAYACVAIAAPYLQLYEDMTLSEAFRFHAALKPFSGALDLAQFCAETGLNAPGDKPLRSFSSGMKQRVKLGFAMLIDAPVLLLDEPCSNLDAAGTAAYRRMLQQQIAKGRVVVVATNSDQREMPDNPVCIQLSES
jgi:ABC-type multidrug transport system ATPase subunit